ncbi:hypothetical protein RB201_26575 [Streptomyces sp. S1A(2023)]
MRRAVHAMVLIAVALIALGASTGTWWVLGVGVWVLIAAFLTELIYRP